LTDATNFTNYIDSTRAATLRGGMRRALFLALALSAALAPLASASAAPDGTTARRLPLPPRSGFTFEASLGVGAIHSGDERAGGPSLFNAQAGTFLTPSTAVGVRVATTSALLKTTTDDTLWFTATFLGLSVQRWIGDRCFVGLGTGAFAATVSTPSPIDVGYDGFGVDLRLALAQPLTSHVSAYAAIETMAAPTDPGFVVTTLQLGFQVF
jgi:hypothetical protein